MSKKFALLCAFLGLACVATAAADPPVVRFSASSYTVPERGNLYAYFTVVRDGDLTANVSFRVKVVNILTGYTFYSSYIFSSGQSQVSLWANEDAQPLDDNYYDPGRGYVMTMMSVTGGVIGEPSTTRIDIIDDEGQPQLSIDDIVVNEGTSLSHNTHAVFTLRVSVETPHGFIVPVTVHDGTAQNGSDFNAPHSTSFFFPPDTLYAEFPVDIIADNLPEGDETFSVEIGAPTNPPIPVAKSIGTCTITDDDGAVGPASQRVARGGKGVIQVRLTDPAASDEQVTLSSSDVFLTFPSSVTIPAGSASADIEIGGTDVGTGVIEVVLPPSRGGRVYACNVSVFEPVAFTIDPTSINIPIGTTANVTAKIDPPPAAPVAVALTQLNAKVADIPQSVVIDAKGFATIPVHGIAQGGTIITASLPDRNGGTTINIIVNVTVPSGLAITSLSKRSGAASGGDSVDVAGNNFGGACAVTFDGVPVQNSRLANGILTVTTPPHDAGDVDVAIRCGANTFVFPGGFTYVASPLAVTKTTPSSGAVRGGTIVIISGASLRTGQCRATFDGIPARALWWSGTTSITVVSPAHAGGNVPVTLTCGSETATLANGFSYVQTDDTAPAVGGVTPRRGAPGDRVTIAGSRFRLDDVLSFGTTNVPDDVPQASSDQHVVVVPELPAGTVPLWVADVAGRTTAAGNFEITAPVAPAITQLDATLTAGEEFAVSGTGFRAALTFTLGPAILKPVTLTSTRALFRVPLGMAAGPTSFAIADHGATAATRAVDVTTNGIAVTAVAPPCASRDGKSLVTITGSGFADGAMVQFGSTYAANVAVTNPFTLVAEVPPAFGANSVVITVINPDGAASTLTRTFAYGDCTPPKPHAVGR